VSDVNDDQLQRAFADLHERTITAIRPVGAVATLATARRRHVRRVVVAAVAALGLSVPFIVYGAAGLRTDAAPAQPPTPPPSSTVFVRSDGLKVASDVVMLTVPDQQGNRTGTLRLTVVNAGAHPVDTVRAAVSLFSTAQSGGDWSRCPAHICQAGTVAPQMLVNFTLPLVVTEDGYTPAAGCSTPACTALGPPPGQ
jgi:hypothetical protein